MERIAGHVEFRSDHIMMFSDYSGQHSTSKCETYAFVVIDERSSRSLPGELRAWRTNQGLGTRTLSFKGLGDSLKQEALVPYLKIWSNVVGACVVVSVAKSVGRLCTGDGTKDIWRAADLGGFQFTARSIEKASRICHFGSILVSLVSRGVNVPSLTWTTDEDDIAANDRTLDALLLLSAGISSLYSRRRKGVLAINTPSWDPDNRLLLEDFVYLADLTAGAACEFTNNAADLVSPPDQTMIELVVADSLTPKSDLILDWISHTGSHMHRGFIAIDGNRQQLRVRLLTPPPDSSTAG